MTHESYRFHPQGLETYSFSTPYEHILPLVKSVSYGFLASRRFLKKAAPEGVHHSLRSICPPSRARTLDRLLKRELLYQLS
jgi:hypothetical protein